MRAFVASAILFLSAATQAALLDFDKSNSQKANVTVKPGLSVQLIGKGVRTKLGGLFTVYDLEFYSSDEWKTRSETDAMPFVDRSKAIALRMTMETDLSPSTIRKSFEEALHKYNNVDISRPEIAKALELVSGKGLSDHQVVTMVILKNDDKSETLYIEDGTGAAAQAVPGPAGFAHDLMLIWLGKPADSGLKSLKNSLINGK
jgi:hypothetical protein